MKTFFLLFYSLSAFALDVSTVYSTSKKSYIKYEEMLSDIPSEGNVVLGEYHYTPVIQNAEGQIIRDLAESKNKVGQVSVGWEFLNFQDAQKITKANVDFQSDKIDETALLSRLFMNFDQASSNKVYLAFLRQLKTVKGELLGLNVPREIKQKIIENGVESLPSSLVPPNYENGGDKYFERFRVAMGNHVPAVKLKPYFVAQSFTDDIMAYQLEKQASYHLRFTINGAFHSDFNDGFVARLYKRSNSKIITLKIVDATKLSADDIKTLVLGSDQYGAYADYIVLAK